jgi:integrase
MARELLGDKPEKYLKTPGKHPDGKGLYLQVAAPGQGSWVVRFGEQWRSLGPFDIFTPEQVRARHLGLWQKKKAGIDPIALIDAEAQSKAIVEAAAEPANETFGTLLTEYLEAAAPSWKGGLTGSEAVNHRSTFAKVPALLKLLVAEVMPKAVAAAVKVYDDNPATQARMRKRIRTILRYGESREVKGKKREIQHLPAMPAKDVPAIMRELAALDSPDARALAFTIHTAPRSGMTLRATWSEITDVDGQPTWIIPAERMKMEKPHRVPLTAAALALLGERGAADELIFRSRIGKKENLGHGAMQLLLKEMRPGLTVHGFRTSFRDWISDDTDFDGDLGELALAHAIGGQSKRAYARSDQLEKRRPVMQAWSDFISTG